jgi:hypothetical protein
LGLPIGGFTGDSSSLVATAVYQNDEQQDSEHPNLVEQCLKHKISIG